MYRLTAKLLLLTLFAGTFAPMAAALSTPAGHEHCARKPMAVRAESTPPCHHHAAAKADPDLTSQADTGLAFRSSQCCSGHECCRSLVRTQSARAGLRTRFQQTDRTEDSVLAFHPHFPRIDLAAYHSVRGPPAL